MIKINLVPQEILDREAAQQRAKIAAVIGALVACVFLAASAFHYWRSVSLQGELIVAQTELDRLQKIVAQVEELEKTAAQVRARLNVVVDLMRYRALYPRFMEDLIRLLPSGVSLTSLTTGGDQKALTVSIGCKALSHEDIAALLRTLEVSDRFKEGTLAGGIATSATPTSTQSTFNMTLKYMPPEGVLR
ncbi:MAG: PilN domain-containing protein [Elusimicrobiota bacterium]|jgi:type IV pilus assembly protein PilN